MKYVRFSPTRLVTVYSECTNCKKKYEAKPSEIRTEQKSQLGGLEPGEHVKRNSEGLGGAAPSTEDLDVYGLHPSTLLALLCSELYPFAVPVISARYAGPSAMYPSLTMKCRWGSSTPNVVRKAKALRPHSRSQHKSSLKVQEMNSQTTCLITDASHKLPMSIY